MRYQQGRQTLEAPCLKLGNLVKEFKIESTTYHLAPKMVYIYILLYLGQYGVDDGDCHERSLRKKDAKTFRGHSVGDSFRPKHVVPTHMLPLHVK